MINLLVDKEYPYVFILNVVNKVKRDIMIEMNIMTFDLVKIDVELNSESYNFGDEFVTSKRIIKEALNNIIVVNTDKEWSIEIDRTTTYKDTDYKLIDLIKLIDSGNMSVKGTHIFSNEFKNIKNKIKSYYLIYERRGYLD